MIQHFFEFVSSGHGEKEISEPINFKNVEFLIRQPNGRWGRDEHALGAGAVSLELSSNVPEHYFDLILFNRRKFGFQAVVKYKLKIDGVIKYTGQVDFATLSTDGKTIIEFSVIEITEKQIFNRRFDIKTNLFSDTRLDESDIDPVNTELVLLKAKPVVAISEWNNPIIGRQMFFNNPIQNADYFNPIKNQVQYDIRDSVTWLTDDNDADGGAFVNFIHVDAKTNLSDITITAKVDIVIDYIPQLENSLTSGKNGQVVLRAYYGQSTVDYQALPTLFTSTFFEGITDQQQVVSTTFEATIPFVNNTDKIWVSFASFTGNGAVIRVTFNECSTKIIASSIAYNTVVPMVRLFDAMQYNALSSSNLPVSAPRWAFPGEFFTQYITTQALMRGLTDKPFNISTKDIVDEYLPEVNGDYQIQEDGTIFYGLYRDFYRNYQIADFTNDELTENFGQPRGQIVGYKEDHNMPYLLDKFNYKYKNYQSQKENQEGNTYDAVHGEAQFYNLNDQVEETKNIEVGFIRDPFMIESARRKAYDLSENTATQDDDKIYIVDVVGLENEDRYFTETSTLLHIPYEGDKLELRNDQTFSWSLLGIGVGTQFVINPVNTNAGTYTVLEVTDISLKLQSSNIPQDIGAVNTNFTYILGNNVNLVIRTNEGFTAIENIADGDNFANLRFTVKRNILNYYSDYLATTMLFNTNKKYKNSLYNNNPTAVTTYGEETAIAEGEDFIPTGAILDSFLYEVKIVMTLQDYLNLMAAQKEHNGYVKTFDSDGLPLKGFIKKGTWVFETAGNRTADSFIGVATFTLESMYQEFYIEIFGSGDGMIVLSNGESASDFNFYIENEKLYIFDETGKQMFVPVPFNRVKVNSSTQAVTTEQLEQWLNLLKN